MIQSLYSATSGLKAQQTNIDTIANNIANINSNGFKKSRVDFKDEIYQNMQDTVAGDTFRVGHGVMVGSTSVVNTDGALIQSDSLLDFALVGDGYFTLMNAEGQPLYTKNGSFNVSNLDGKNYLTSSDGYFVLDTKGNRIELPGDLSSLSCDTNGNLSINDKALATISVVDIPNPKALESAGLGNFVGTASSGNPVLANDTTILQGHLEASNVDLAEEMTRLIRAQRAFSLMSRVVTTSDEMESTANSIRP